MARRDVEIRVRAKDEASRNAKKIADALRLIGQDGKKATGGAKETSVAFSQMAADAARLQSSLSGLKSLGTLVGQMEKAGASVTRISDEIGKATKGFESIRAITAQYTQQSAELTTKLRAEEAAIASRNADLKAATALARENRDATLALARAQDVLNGKARKGVSASGNAASAGVGVEAGAPQSSARASFGAFLAADIAKAAAEKNQLRAVVDGLEQEIAASEKAIIDYGTELKKVAANEKEFATETAKSGNALLALRADLAAAKVRLASTEEGVLSANAALGTLALTQDDVAAAAARATAKLEQQERALAVFQKFAGKRLTGGRGTLAEPASDKSAEAFKLAREELEILRAEQARLDTQLKSSSGNVTAQVDAYNRMTTAVKLAEENIRKLEIAQRLVDSAGNRTGYGKWIAGYEGGLARVAAADSRAAVARQTAERELARIAAQSERTASSTRRLAQATTQAAQAQQEFGRDSRTTLSFTQRLRGEVIALVTAYVGLFGVYNRVREAAIAFRQVEAAQTRLGVAFGGDLGKVRQEMAFLNAESDRLGFTFNTLAAGYSKISIAASNAGFSIRDTRDLFTAITEAARVNGSTVEDTNGILKAFEQILNKGKIQAEELTGQIGDRGLPAFKLFADALGVTSAELTKMLKAGEVFANRETLLKAADRLKAVYSSQLPAALASTGFALDSFADSAEEINLLLAEGMVGAIKEAAEELAKFVDSAEGREAFRDIGEAIGVVISLLAQVPEYFDEIATVAKVLLTIGIARWATGFSGAVITVAERIGQLTRASTGLMTMTNTLSGGQIRLARATSVVNGVMLDARSRLSGVAARSRFLLIPIRALQGAVGALRLSFIALSGVANALFGGIAGIAVGGVITALLNWKTEADKATDALEIHKNQVDLVRQAYSEATGDVRDWNTALNDLTASQAAAALKELETRYQNAANKIARTSRIILGEFALLIEANPSDPLSKQAVELNNLAEEFAAGRLDIRYFIAALDDLATNGVDESIRALALEMLNFVNKTEDGAPSLLDLQKGIDDARAVLGLFSPATKKASEGVIGLKNEVDGCNTAFQETTSIESYTEALDDLKSKIPSLADDMERLQKTTELNASAWTALIAAWNSGDVSKIREVAGLWLRGVAENGLAAVTSDLNNAGGAGGAAAALIKRFEGLRDDLRPYDDGKTDANGNRVGPPIYRTGYGSDTFTRQDGTFGNVAKDTVITRADAERDLLRRIPEYQATIVKQIGADRFASFDPNQQAVLTSIAYNYGSLPGRIADAIQTGNAQEIAKAISSLRGNNGGKNAGRRDLEAAIFAQGGDADLNVLVQAQAEALKLREDQRKATQETLSDLEQQRIKQDLINQGKEREATIVDAINAARKENPNITEPQLAAIREHIGLLYDQQNAQTGLELSEERVNHLYELRSQLAEQLRIAQENGDAGGIAQLNADITALDLKLGQAITKAIAMWSAVGGVEADAAIAKLQTMRLGLQDSSKQVAAFGLSSDTFFGIFQGAVQGVVGAFDAFAQAIVSGENAFVAFGRSALQVLAQVLQQIAAAIIQMQILTFLQGLGGGIGGFATKLLGASGHTGGVVGSRAIGAGNSFGRPDWMRAALTYHTGGIAGLAPDEVSATLKQGEEVLTEEDPRHRFNQGGSETEGKGGRLTQVLAIGEKQVQEMLNMYGSEATLTHIKTNAPTIRRMLGVA